MNNSRISPNRKFIGKETVLNNGNQIVINHYDIEHYGKDISYADLGHTNFTEDRRSRSLMPPEYCEKFGKDFDWKIYGCDTSSQKQIVNAFICNFEKWKTAGKGLYIYSEVAGSGKTLLSCCIVNELLNKLDLVVKFISVVDLIELSRLKNKNDTYNIDLNAISNCQVLILDDIGTEMSREWIEQFLYGFIDHRKKYRLITIYTSNIKPENLKLNDRIKSRIEQNSIPLALPEVSIRRMKAQKDNMDFMREVLA